MLFLEARRAPVCTSDFQFSIGDACRYCVVFDNVYIHFQFSIGDARRRDICDRKRGGDKLSILYWRCRKTFTLTERDVAILTFNSLLEMHHVADRRHAVYETPRLSILYWRCLRGTGCHIAAGARSLSILYWRCVRYDACDGGPPYLFFQFSIGDARPRPGVLLDAEDIFQFSIGDANWKECTIAIREPKTLSILYWRCRRPQRTAVRRRLAVGFQFSIGDAHRPK